jgi:thiol-disulfide isomerase/thioredoxin
MLLEAAWKALVPAAMLKVRLAQLRFAPDGEARPGSKSRMRISWPFNGVARFSGQLKYRRGNKKVCYMRFSELRCVSIEVSGNAKPFAKSGTGSPMKNLRYELLAFCVSGLIAALAAHLCAAQMASDVSSALERADALALQKRIPEALEAYRAADKLSGHTCADCLLHIATTELLLGDISGAVEDSRRAAQAAGDDKVLAADAHLLRGQILSATAGEPTDPKVKEAEQEFREAIAASPKKSKARFSLGMLLLGEGREAEGVAELKAYVSGSYSSPKYVDRAKRIIADPSRARTPESENFSFTTMEGERISKDALRGKVVLLDFWGTWCPPCRESVPMVAEIHKKFEGKEFQLVGISSDDDERAWKDFIASHHMNWSEYLDVDGQVQSLFEISAFPTFVVLDRDGGIEFRQSGLGDDTERDLESAIHGALRKSVTSQPRSTAGIAPTTPSGTGSVAASVSDDEAAATSQWQAWLLPLGAGIVKSASGTGASPADESAKLVLPADEVDDGDADANIYRNEFLGLSCRYPKSWKVATPEELDQLNGRTKLWMGEHVPHEGSRNPFPKTLFEAKLDSRGNAPFIRITVERSEAFVLETVQRNADELKRLRGLTILEAPRVIVEGKRTSFRTDFQLPQADSAIWITSIETFTRGYRVRLEFYARSPEELGSLIRSSR